MSNVKLTPTQQKVLGNIHDHGDPLYGVTNMQERGGTKNSASALRRLHLVDDAGGITEAGTAVLESLRAEEKAKVDRERLRREQALEPRLDDVLSY